MLKVESSTTHPRTSPLKSFGILFPFFLTYLGAIFINVNHSVSTILKLSSFAYMSIYVITCRKTDRNLLILLLLFLPFWIYGIFHSFHIKAGIEDGIRYMFSVAALFYGYCIRKHLPLVIKFIAIFVVLNFLVQLVNYYNWIRGVDQWYYYRINNVRYYARTMGGILRGTGLVTEFAFYAFMNAVSFFILYAFYRGKYRKIVLGTSVLGFLSALSYKTMVSVLVIIMYFFRRHLLKVLTGLVLIAIILTFYFPEQTKKFVQDMEYRLQAYIIEGKTARTESYRVMFDEIKHLNFFGRGIGAFGGPASTKYHSPYYQESGFNWYEMAWANLSTTDTYLPHPIVELGIIGSFFYFLLLTAPIFRRKVPVLIIIIYFLLFFDMLFTFSLNNLEYMMYSLVLIYPILYQYNQLKSSANSHENRISFS